MKNLITKILSGKFSAAELNRFKRWYEESEKNRTLFEDSKREWYRQTRINIPEEEIERSLQAIKSISGHSTRLPKRTGYNLIKYAVAASIVLLSVFAIRFMVYDREVPEDIAAVTEELIQDHFEVTLTLADGRKFDLATANVEEVYGEEYTVPDGDELTPEKYHGHIVSGYVAKEPARFNTVETAPGKRYMLALSDGTKVWLNGGSKLRFPEQFRDGRRFVESDGECYFEVAHDPRNPFIVSAGSMEIEVLGTSFNLNTYSFASGESMTLCEGRVKFKSSTTEIIATAGTRVEVNRDTGEITKRITDTDAYTGWMNNRYVIEEKLFGEALAYIETWYGVEIVNGANLPANLRINGKFDRMDLESVIRSLCINTSTNYVFDRSVNRITITN